MSNMRPELAAEYVPSRMLNNILPLDSTFSTSSRRKWSEIKANIRHPGITGSYSLLHAYAEYDRISILELLLKKGANVNALYQGRTPLELSLRQGRKACARALLEHGADVTLVLKPNSLRGMSHQMRNARPLYKGLDADWLVTKYQEQQAWEPWLLNGLFAFALILLLFSGRHFVTLLSTSYYMN
jgi:ankyrin repeat protein